LVRHRGTLLETTTKVQATKRRVNNVKGKKKDGLRFG